jgi:hypothetical protein
VGGCESAGINPKTPASKGMRLGAILYSPAK